jgi:hypothetical protein
LSLTQAQNIYLESDPIPSLGPTHLLELDDIFVEDVAAVRREESDGRQQQHHVLVRPPLRVKRLKKAKYIFLRQLPLFDLSFFSALHFI